MAEVREATPAAGYAAAGRPTRHLAIVTCMDTRLTRLLPDALELANGDAAIVKVAGATIVDPYGEAMRSLLVAVPGFTINVYTGELSARPPADAGDEGADPR